MLLLVSRGEELRSLLNRLEVRYELLEKMLEEEDAKNEEKRDTNSVLGQAELKSNRTSSTASTNIDMNVNESGNGDENDDKVKDMGGRDINIKGEGWQCGFNSRPRRKSNLLGNENFDWSDTDREMPKMGRYASEERDMIVDMTNRSIGSGDIGSRRGDVRWLKNDNVGDNKNIAASSSAKDAKMTNIKDNNESSGGWLVPFFMFNRRSSCTTTDTAITKARLPPRLSKSLPPRLPTSSMTLSVDESNTNLEVAIEEGESTKSSTEAGCSRASLLKLHGLDMASYTLHQLLSYKRRSLCDLRYQQSTLQSTSFFTEQVEGFQFKILRSKLHSAKVERRRKMRMLTDIQSKIKVSADQEERLRGELDSIHTELYRLKREMATKDE